MRSCWLFVLSLVSAIPLSAAEPARPTPLRLLVPAYFYPGGKGLEEWKRMARAAKDVPIVAIANPASGPGGRRDPNYTEVIELAREAGVTVIGYVSTSYAKRPEAAVRADIDGWLKFYPNIDGFFFDEQASGKELVPYYESLARYVETRKKEGAALVVTNPGTSAAAEYLTPWMGIHISCLQENRFGLDRYQPPSWSTRIPVEQVLGLVYNEPSVDRMRQNLQLAAAKGVGFVYVTDDGGNNPWDRLPTYWEQEVAELHRAFGGGVPPSLGKTVPDGHQAYGFLSQMKQEGWWPGLPNGADLVPGKLSRLQLGRAVYEILHPMSTEPARRKPAGSRAREWVKAMEALTREFPSELALHGVTAARAKVLVDEFAVSLGLPKKR